jgi:aspartyl-tRNA(Asn)/glutamyl-tRNA(Gln) amidotransferase subunit A
MNIMSDELCKMTISELAPKIKARKISPVELTQAVLDRIEKLDPKLNAYITVDAEGALKAAKKVQRQMAKGAYLGPLHGIPISLKDLYDTKGLRTTAGSKIMSDRVPDADATSVAKLRAAGAIIVGKTNMHEFAFGDTTQNPHFGGARNPYDTGRIPGGSSGGSAAAVAADMCIASAGSDTGGSIRKPAALCGIVGLKPTYGRVSLRGVVPLAWSLDHVGPMTKCVRDAAVMLSAMAGYDPGDPTSANEKVPSFTRALKNDVKKLRIGFDSSFSSGGVDGEVLQSVERALKLFEKLGARACGISRRQPAQSPRGLWRRCPHAAGGRLGVFRGPLHQGAAPPRHHPEGICRGFQEDRHFRAADHADYGVAHWSRDCVDRGNGDGFGRGLSALCLPG